MNANRTHTAFAALVLGLVTTLFFPALARALEPNGSAVYSELGSELYIGTLFLEARDNDPQRILAADQKKRMEIRFTGQMTRRRWVQNWTQSIAINSSREAMTAAAAELSEALSAFRGNLEPGDQVVIEYDPARGTSLAVDGVPIVEGKSKGLFDLFLSAWIGPVPPSTDFKEAILGKVDSSATYARFLALQPSEARIAAIEAWDTPVKRAAAELAAAEEEARRQAEEEARRKAEEEARRQAEAEARRKAEEEARRQAEVARTAEAAPPPAPQPAPVEVGEAPTVSEAAVASTDAEAAEEEEPEISVEAILAQQDYATRVIRKIYREVKFPRRAVERGLEGSVRARITLDRDGRLLAVETVEGSGEPLLDEAALDAIRDAAPFPAMPEGIGVERLELMVPISFRLQ
ncbi:MAG: hypothetical protein KatS3mg124_1355 [Porticoccaceae bacterium]|nr:MAG: hypothetical protein KatS3mg124_1355 [Porticoccaceae bacterium]